MMKSFYNVLKRSIDRQHEVQTKEYYQEVIAQWLLKKYLTEEEADSLLAYLDEVYGTSEV